MAKKKSKKTQANRKESVSAAVLLEQSEVVETALGEFRMLVREFEAAKGLEFKVDGFQKFGRGAKLIKDYIAAVKYFKARQ